MVSVIGRWRVFSWIHWETKRQRTGLHGMRVGNRSFFGAWSIPSAEWKERLARAQKSAGDEQSKNGKTARGCQELPNETARVAEQRFRMRACRLFDFHATDKPDGLK